MSKLVKIPINEFDYYSTDGTYVGIKFRYRLKKDSTDNDVSQWSEVNELIFQDSDNQNITLSEANGYDKPTSLTRVDLLSSLKWTSDNSKMLPSQIDQITSQTDITNTFNPDPKSDGYRLSWIVPDNFNVNNFDVFTSWKNLVFLSGSADITAPSGTGPYTGTITLDGTGKEIRSQTIKSYYEWLLSAVAADKLAFYTTPGTRVAGNTFIVTGYSGVGDFAVRSANTWTGTSTSIKNLSMNYPFSTPEYITTISTNRYEFSRNMQSNRVSAIIKSGSSVIQLDKNPALANLCSGMKLVKKSGDGEFAYNATISQIDYQNNRLFVSTSNSASTTVSTTGTIGTVTSSGGVWSATITGMQANSTNNLEVGYMISATAGTGTFGSGIIRVSSIVSGTSITITSNKTFTAGTITNIIAQTKSDTTNHTQSGYIEFVGDSSTSFDLTFSGKTVKHYWSIPHFCQAIVCAPTLDRDYTNLYTLLSVTESQFLYFGGMGRISATAGTGPYTATLTELNYPYSSTPANAGYRMYANPTTTGGGSFGTGEVKVAGYESGITVSLISTAPFTTGYVYGIRL